MSDKAEKLLVTPANQKASICVGVCGVLTLFLIYAVSVTRSLVITGLAWMSVFSLFSSASAIVAYFCKSHHTTTKRFTFGKVRAPVLSIFSTTVLAQLSAVFLTKEAVERLFDSGQHHHSHHGGEAANFGGDAFKTSYLFFPAAFASATSLLVVAYALKDQPFNYVLKHASSSVIQEHASDISSALCYFVPGLSRLLLPRINSLTLLVLISTSCAAFVHWFSAEFAWVDAAATLALSFVVFTTMMPLSTFTGRILLQTTPPHIQNQIDRFISEASTVEGVLELINCHFWQLDFNTIVGTVDVRVRRDADEQVVQRTVHNKLSAIVNNCTVQVLKDPSSVWKHQNPQHYSPALYNSSTTQAVPQFRAANQTAAVENNFSATADDGHGHNHGHGHSHGGGGGGHSHSHAHSHH